SAQAAKDARLLTGAEDGKVGRFDRAGMAPRILRVPAPQELRQHRVDRGARRVADLTGQAQQRVAVLPGPVEQFPAGRARAQVPLIAILVVRGQVVGEQSLPTLKARTGGRGRHDRSSGVTQGSSTDWITFFSRAKTRLRAL